MKKSNFFVNLKRHLQGSFFYNLQTFRGFFQVRFYDFVVNSARK